MPRKNVMIHIAKCCRGFETYKSASASACTSHSHSHKSPNKMTDNHVEQENRPKLIVFDLDYTMWPYHVDSTVSLPFKLKDSKVFDQSGQEIKPFPEALQVLEYLTSNGYTLAAASRTQRPPDAQKLLEFLDWTKYFAFKEIYPGSKGTHFARFKDQTNLPYSSMLFFDDEPRNIREVSQLGVKCVLVPDGINMKLLHDSITDFNQVDRNRKCN